MKAERYRFLRPKMWRCLIGGIVIILLLILLIFPGTQSPTIFALTISELKTRGSAIYGQSVRVSGTVDGYSIVCVWDAQEKVLKFNLVEGEEILTVIYKGTRPDMFRDGAEALVEGKLQGSGVFEATKLLLKCPSKYEAAATKTITK